MRRAGRIANWRAAAAGAALVLTLGLAACGGAAPMPSADPASGPGQGASDPDSDSGGAGEAPAPVPDPANDSSELPGGAEEETGEERQSGFLPPPPPPPPPAPVVEPAPAEPVTEERVEITTLPDGRQQTTRLLVTTFPDGTKSVTRVFEEPAGNVMSAVAEPGAGPLTGQTPAPAPQPAPSRRAVEEAFYNIVADGASVPLGSVVDAPLGALSETPLYAPEDFKGVRFWLSESLLEEGRLELVRETESGETEVVTRLNAAALGALEAARPLQVTVLCPDCAGPRQVTRALAYAGEDGAAGDADALTEPVLVPLRFTAASLARREVGGLSGVGQTRLSVEVREMLPSKGGLPQSALLESMTASLLFDTAADGRATLGSGLAPAAADAPEAPEADAAAGALPAISGEPEVGSDAAPSNGPDEDDAPNLHDAAGQAARFLGALTTCTDLRSRPEAWTGARGDYDLYLRVTEDDRSGLIAVSVLDASARFRAAHSARAPRAEPDIAGGPAFTPYTPQTLVGALGESYPGIAVQIDSGNALGSVYRGAGAAASCREDEGRADCLERLIQPLSDELGRSLTTGSGQVVRTLRKTYGARSAEVNAQGRNLLALRRALATFQSEAVARSDTDAPMRLLVSADGVSIPFQLLSLPMPDAAPEDRLTPPEAMWGRHAIISVRPPAIPCDAPPGAAGGAILAHYSVPQEEGVFASALNRRRAEGGLAPLGEASAAAAHRGERQIAGAATASTLAVAAHLETGGLMADVRTSAGGFQEALTRKPDARFISVFTHGRSPRSITSIACGSRGGQALAFSLIDPADCFTQNRLSTTFAEIKRPQTEAAMLSDVLTFSAPALPASPVVVINACDAGATDFDFGRETLPSLFIEEGARAVIASEMPIRISVADAISTRIAEELAAGADAGLALHRARRAALVQNGRRQPSAIFYSLYGLPSATLIAPAG